ncbi:MAG: MFS transporter [Bacteroidetes bacterium]|nr:MFS transporter [Bacteroidota bacterium]
MKSISRVVLILSVVSLFTDMASEMLYPIMPIYLQQIGFSVIWIGILEGFAEAIAGLSKGYFGKLSDRSGKRVPFVQAGYALSAISKPLLALFVQPLWVFTTRTLDRLGKGIRTGARDALLSDEAKESDKGKVFGFHRAMDTMGAVLGPLLALLYLHYFPEDYRTLFLIALFPGLIAVWATGKLKEAQRPVEGKDSVSFFSFLNYVKQSRPEYRRILIGLLFFALANSSDVFLLLKAKEAGLSDIFVIGIYIFYNLIYAIFAFPLGSLADRIGLERMVIAGLLLFAMVYFLISVAEGPKLLLVCFFLYGLYAAATEGVSKAWLSTSCDKKETATAIGTFTAFQSLTALVASSLAGIIWFNLGAKYMFIFSAVLTLAVVIYFMSTRSHAGENR